MYRKPVNRRTDLRVIVDHNLCFHCGACVAVCPPNSIMLDNVYLRIDDRTCTCCERCSQMCPVHALSLVDKVSCNEPMM